MLDGSAGGDVLRGGNGADVLLGATGDDLLAGNAGVDVLAGEEGIDDLRGGDDNDFLLGGDGNDWLAGGIGEDVFVFDTAPSAANIDLITDFDSTQEVIGLDPGIFSSLVSPAGESLLAGEFAANATGVAEDGADRIVYSTDTGTLYYDSDGTGAAAPIAFAVLTGAPDLDAGNLYVFTPI